MAESREGEIAADLRAAVDDRDVGSSATLQAMEDVTGLLAHLESKDADIDVILDLGCGYGALAAFIGELVGATEIHGIDIDDERRQVAADRGVEVYDLDLEDDPFPFDDGAVDLVLSFGVLEHLQFFDHAVEESHRVLSDDGYVLYSVPNLGSWVNRLALLFGNQPRDVEFSRVKGFGISDRYPDDAFLFHLHTPTYGAFLEFLEHYGFGNFVVTGLHPDQPSRLVALVDRLVARRPSLCRRIAVLGQKVE